MRIKTLLVKTFLLRSRNKRKEILMIENINSNQLTTLKKELEFNPMDQ